MRVYAKNKSIAIKDEKQLNRIKSYLKYNNYPAYILFIIGLGTGYRGGDLVELTVEDIKKALENRALIILENKTKDTRKKSFERIAYLGEKLSEILKEYIKDKEDSEYIYPSQKGKGKGRYKTHISRERLGKIFKEAASKVGIENVSIGTHTPRKTFGYIQYITHDKDINYVQELFGHSSSKVTKAYIGIDEDILKESADIIDMYI